MAVSAVAVTSVASLHALRRSSPAAAEYSHGIHPPHRQAARQPACATVARAARRDAQHDISNDWLNLVDPEVNSERAVGRGGRAQLRTKVHNMLGIAKKLSGLTTNQLKRIQHLLATPVLEATMRAQAITGTNQGRSREDKLVGKLLRREHTNEELEAIHDAVQAITAAANSGHGQSQARALATSWCDRLLAPGAASPISQPADATAVAVPSGGSLAEDAVVVEAEVSEAAVASGDDVSHFRNLLRRARTAKQTAEVASQVAEGERNSGGQKVQAAKKASKRARADLTKWLLGVAESAVLG
eukprot:jgi/Ulvmu1/8514/UM044_0048.1